MVTLSQTEARAVLDYIRNLEKQAFQPLTLLGEELAQNELKRFMAPHQAAEGFQEGMSKLRLAD